MALCLPREGRMAFIRTPDTKQVSSAPHCSALSGGQGDLLSSVELLQKGGALPVAEPWASMPNVGHW